MPIHAATDRRRESAPIVRNPVPRPAPIGLRVTSPGDAWEQDANRVAARVLAMPSPHASPCACDGSCPRCRQAVSSRSGDGDPLDAQMRAFMEPRFGRSFEDVRVHAGGDSERAARAFDAHAFTVGKDIYFGRGAFLPGSMETRATIAHELAHVVQQEAGAPPMVARQSIREKWSAFWDAGPVDSYRASELATAALQAARNTGLDGLEDGPADAWRHCYWNCRMVQVIGKEDAAEIATNHEKYGKGKLAAGMMDIWNNEEGRACSGNCDSCCQDKLDAGKLWILYGGKVGASERTNRRPGSPRVEKYDKY